MKISKDFLTRLLILSSILSLVLIQVFWLHASYERTMFDFERDAIYYLRATMEDLRDSVFRSNLKPVGPDSLPKTLHIRRMRADSSAGDSIHRAIVALENGIHSDGKVSSNVKVIISSVRDSLGSDVIRPLRSALGEIRNKGQGANFVIRIDEDTLDIRTLRERYRARLSANGLDLPFTLNEAKGASRKSIRLLGDRPEVPDRKHRSWSELYAGKFVFGPVTYNPVRQYEVHFDKTLTFFLLRDLTPEIAFCIVLTLLTVSAFYLIHRNLRRQQRLMELKDEFIGNVSHELKTPIATVSVALEALQNFGAANNPQLIHEYLAIAKSQVSSLAAITDKILRTSLLEYTHDKYSFTSIDIRKVAEEAVAKIRLLATSTGARLEYTTEGEDFQIEGAPELLELMIVNLLENALKYSPVNGDVKLTLISNPDSVLIEVEDNGIGIKSEYQSRIFEKFFRVPTGNVHNVKGFGLGLSYVSAAVDAHQGKISVKSTEGQGSTFSINLPRKKISGQRL